METTHSSNIEGRDLSHELTFYRKNNNNKITRTDLENLETKFSVLILMWSGIFPAILMLRKFFLETEMAQFTYFPYVSSVSIRNIS